MKASHWIGILLGLVSCAASAVDFEYGDWAVACDNTRRCEAVGFQRENKGEEPVALYLLREAGPDEPVFLRLMLDTGRGKVPDKVSITVGQVILHDLIPEQVINTDDAAKLIPALLKGERAEVRAGTRHWAVSLDGASAALLKMDDLQGRVGTPGALVRKGTKSESSVLRALPVPVLRAARLDRARPGDERLLGAILKAIGKRDCSRDEDDPGRMERSLQRLSGGKVLVMIQCGQGAYQSGSDVWIANGKPPYAPVPAVLPPLEDNHGNSVSNGGFDDGVLSSYDKWRATMECATSTKWLWTAQGFKLLEATRATMCRGFPEGIDLRIWTANLAPK
ncbi:DUF1176 domain-containing protein [Massilia genomosp. 1]|uniref:DUF1176 domain-containing protein n=1 Tax=Massilia genomosp. 1 TaxID=2609280 RepID=A0ABX0N2W2_9BURK|nr:DUF1176 domain-containing protein [Massilia genomosp. 1]NHZ66973.1 DUF1176 domain-containing protein [Massilia genomosp. 1]